MYGACLSMPKPPQGVGGIKRPGPALVSSCMCACGMWAGGRTHFAIFPSAPLLPPPPHTHTVSQCSRALLPPPSTASPTAPHSLSVSIQPTTHVRTHTHTPATLPSISIHLLPTVSTATGRQSIVQARYAREPARSCLLAGTGGCGWSMHVRAAQYLTDPGCTA